jgi:large subunit ribosomal protein L9
MEIILLENVDSLGKIGDLLKVADGYARNFLIPQKLAMVATKRNTKDLEHKQRIVEAKKKRDVADAGSLAAKVESLQLTIPAKVGEEDKLYGSITRRNIAEALAKEGVKVERKQILLAEPIRSTGVFDVDLKVHQDVTAKMRVWVVAE